MGFFSRDTNTNTDGQTTAIGPQKPLPFVGELILTYDTPGCFDINYFLAYDRARMDGEFRCSFSWCNFLSDGDGSEEQLLPEELTGWDERLFFVCVEPHDDEDEMQNRVANKRIGEGRVESSGSVYLYLNLTTEEVKNIGFIVDRRLSSGEENPGFKIMIVRPRLPSDLMKKTYQLFFDIEFVWF